MKPTPHVATARTAHPPTPLAPPAIWSAFARQGQWKNWMLLGQLLVMALLVLACLSIAKTDPDVVVVDAEGTSHYVQRSVASAALIRFLAEQKSQPSDVTVVSFTKRFMTLFFAPNSSTVRGAVAEALSMMDPKLKATSEAELARGKTVEKLEALKVKADLSIDALDEVERTEGLIHVRVKLTRTLSSLVDGSNPKADALALELVLRVVPRTLTHPDGLEVAEMVVATGGKEAGHAR